MIWLRMVIHDRVRQHQEKLFSKLERSSLRTVSIYFVCESCYGYFEVYNSERQQQRRHENYYHLHSTVKRERFFAHVYLRQCPTRTTVSAGPMKVFRLEHETINQPCLEEKRKG